MKTFSIAVLPGDGVGLEVMPEALRVLDALARRHDVTWNYTNFDWGSNYYFQHGRMMPAGGIDQLRPFDAILLGAVGHPDIPDHTTLNGLLLPIRRSFQQWACERPAKLYRGVRSPLADKEPGSIDLVVVRENTEGEYSQIGGFLYQHTSDEVAVQTSVFTRLGVERIIRYAFDLARRRNGKKRVTSITKSNAQGFTMVLWDRTFAEVARECTLLGIRQASRAVTQIYDAALAPIGLKGNQLSLLVAISRMGEPTITRLGEGLVTDRTTLTRNLAPLERAGLVRLEVGADRRSRIVTVTPRGSKRLAEAYPLWKRAQARVIRAMGRSRWQGLLDHLSEVTALARK